MEEKDVPRYEAPAFRAPEQPGSALQYHGGKLVDGIIRYPAGVHVDWEKAARAQAFMDFSYRPGNHPQPDPQQEAFYGLAYTEKFQFLQRESIIRRVLDGVLHHRPQPLHPKK